jgi:hypothetical protein
LQEAKALLDARAVESWPSVSAGERVAVSLGIEPSVGSFRRAARVPARRPLAGHRGFEPLTSRFVAGRSIQSS